MTLDCENHSDVTFPYAHSKPNEYYKVVSLEVIDLQNNFPKKFLSKFLTEVFINCQITQT
jgi:hypothetical protein